MKPKDDILERLEGYKEQLRVVTGYGKQEHFLSIQDKIRELEWVIG